MGNKNIKNGYKNKEIGGKGENLACQYLEQLGHDIIKRNFQDRVGEIDIISHKDPNIHFIEVKTISRETQKEIIHETNNSIFYNPAEKINKNKIRKMRLVAEKFLFENNIEEEAYQLDLIIITIYDGGFRYNVEIIENINFD